MMPVLALFVPITAAAQLGGGTGAGRPSFVPHNDRAGSALELQPGEVARPAADEWLRECEEHHQQSRWDGVEFWFDTRVQHVGKSDTERPAEHQIRNDAHLGQKDAETEKENGRREPLNAPEVVRDL